MQLPRRRVLEETLNAQERISKSYAQSLPTPELQKKVMLLQKIVDNPEDFGDTALAKLKEKIASYQAELDSRSDAGQ